MTKRMKMYTRYEKVAYERFLEGECRLAKKAEELH